MHLPSAYACLAVTWLAAAVGVLADDPPNLAEAPFVLPPAQGRLATQPSEQPVILPALSLNTDAEPNSPATATAPASSSNANSPRQQPQTQLPIQGTPVTPVGRFLDVVRRMRADCIATSYQCVVPDTPSNRCKALLRGYGFSINAHLGLRLRCKELETLADPDVALEGLETVLARFRGWTAVHLDRLLSVMTRTGYRSRYRGQCVSTLLKHGLLPFELQPTEVVTSAAAAAGGEEEDSFEDASEDLPDVPEDHESVVESEIFYDNEAHENSGETAVDVPIVPKESSDAEPAPPTLEPIRYVNFSPCLFVQNQFANEALMTATRVISYSRSHNHIPQPLLHPLEMVVLAQSENSHVSSILEQAFLSTSKTVRPEDFDQVLAALAVSRERIQLECVKLFAGRGVLVDMDHAQLCMKTMTSPFQIQAVREYIQTLQRSKDTEYRFQEVTQVALAHDDLQRAAIQKVMLTTVRMEHRPEDFHLILRRFRTTYRQETLTCLDTFLRTRTPLFDIRFAILCVEQPMGTMEEFQTLVSFQHLTNAEIMEDATDMPIFRNCLNMFVEQPWALAACLPGQVDQRKMLVMRLVWLNHERFGVKTDIKHIMMAASVQHSRDFMCMREVGQTSALTYLALQKCLCEGEQEPIDDTCLVCLEQLDEISWKSDASSDDASSDVSTQILEWPGCLHCFHSGCAARWIGVMRSKRQVPTCPTCRRVSVHH